MVSWQLHAKNQALVKSDASLGSLEKGNSRIQVAGCGLCHTDLGFIYTDVKTRHNLPLALGHEISGIVVEGDKLNQQVVIPAVLPCGECGACKSGNDRICSQQVMPGNDIHGGFSEFIDVPSRFLVEIPEKQDQETLSRFSIIADAVTTPLQSIHNLELKKAELAVIIGCGGVGSYAALIAKAYGANVIAIDIDDRKLEKLNSVGIHHTLNIKGIEPRDVKSSIKEIVKNNNCPRFGHKIFETSGTKAGQELAFTLMGFGSRIAVVGFTMEKVNIRMSNLMAYDARLIGNWGASPSVYAEAIQLAISGDLHLNDFTELYPLDKINEVITMAHKGELIKRAVLVPGLV